MNENATVVLINGIHTAGVLGAARTFGGRREALRNFHATAAAGVSNTGFECHFEVPALNGDVRVPIVESGNVLSLGVAKEATMAVQASVSQRTTTAADAGSATVLFIAGDRGGSQVNQLQIPTEYHEIQTALRGSEYRGVIALANP